MNVLPRSLVFLLEVTVNKCGFYVEELGVHVIDSTEQDRLEKKETAAEDVDWELLQVRY